MTTAKTRLYNSKTTKAQLQELVNDLQSKLDSKTTPEQTLMPASWIFGQKNDFSEAQGKFIEGEMAAGRIKVIKHDRMSYEIVVQHQPQVARRVRAAFLTWAYETRSYWTSMSSTESGCLSLHLLKKNGR